MTGRLLMAALLAGWLAEELARPDRDVEAGIEAYEAGELDVALERFEAAISRHGDRPELSLNRGLVLLAKGETDAARRAFERASESDDPEVRASAFYERGNVAFDAEEWDAAIEAYIECLKARPDHANAKWNLELARLRKQQDQEDDEEEEDEQEDDEQEDGTTGGEDSGGSDESGDTSGGSDDGTTGGEDSGGTTGGSDGGGSDGGETGDDGTTGGSGGSDGGGTGGEGETGQPPSDEGGTGEPPPAAGPPPIEQVDIDRALEELDQQDHFPLDRPVGGVRPPTEDW